MDLVPAKELAARSRARFPNESAAYREARLELLAEEIELRRHIERVAEQRRNLPPGGLVPEVYRFEGEHGPITLSELFGDKDSLVVYKYMFGPERARPCPMCTAFMGSFVAKIPDLEQQIAIAFVARSPIARLVETRNARGWQALPVYSDASGAFTRAYVDPEDGDVPGLAVFTRRDGAIRHFWSGEIGGEMADPGQDPRGAPEVDPIWAVLDMTPGGRGDWYPKLEYPPAELAVTAK